MKKIILLMALFSAITFYGQQKVATRVQELISSKTTFRPVAPLTLAANPNSAGINAVVDKATFAVLNDSLVKGVAVNRYNAIELTIPYNGGTVTMQLYRADVMAEGFHIDTDRGNAVSYTAGAYYRGIIKGDSTSIAAFSFFNGEMYGIVSSSQLHNLVIGRLRAGGNFTDYIIYSDTDLSVAPHFECAVDDTSSLPGHSAEKNLVHNVQSNNCVSVYFEVRHNLFLQNNSDITQATNWLTALFNNVQALYDNDGISTAIKSIYIWTGEDPYDANSFYGYITQFHNYRPVFDGDAGQLLSADGMSLGGLSESVGGLCSTANVSYANAALSYQAVPVYSWAVNVVTHELGHVFGSQHTHGCYWNGNNTAIDGCGTSAGYVEGDCPIGPVPSAQEQGTIMSYCHLVAGVGINFANGFGPQPSQRIKDTIASSSCLGTDCINSCINTVAALALTDTGTDTASFSWSDNTGGPWQTGYAPIGEAIINWQVSPQNTLTLTGLEPDTYYTFAVRNECPAGQAAASVHLDFSTGAGWCSGTIWTDSGGTAGTYLENQHTVTIIKPQNSGESVTVTFNSFETQYMNDYMFVYNGIGTSAPLIGSYSGYVAPGPFEAANADGALTFEFISIPYTVPIDGWAATVSCTLGTSANSFKTLSYYPNPVDEKVTVNAAEKLTHISIYNMAGQLLAEKDNDKTACVINMSAYAAGVYIIKASDGTQTTNLKIIKK